MEYDRKYLLLRLLLFVSHGGNSCVWRTAVNVFQDSENIVKESSNIICSPVYPA